MGEISLRRPGSMVASANLPAPNMWSALRNIFRRVFGGSSSPGQTFQFPKNIDKLREEYQFREELEPTEGGVAARDAYQLAAELIEDFDATARLARIESLGDLSLDGRAQGWFFQFHLPERWGEASFDFSVKPGEESLTLLLKPFVKQGSAMAKLMEDGQAGFVEQQWKVELERCPSLPKTFRDSVEVFSRWQAAGHKLDQLPPGVVLRALTPPLGVAKWELAASSKEKKSLYSLPIE